ncbi:MAG: hypothetical protein IEMM0008_0094 [bacterium]|nr:MAG: hypothetical protein IEMM0008_0094 [bacterium]
MGLIYAEVLLSNAEDDGLARRGFIKKDEIRRGTFNAMVDTGAYMMVISEHIRLQLGLEIVEEREVELADGTFRKIPMAGPINVRFEKRLAICHAFILGSEVLLGAIPLEELDVMVDPKKQRLIVNPENPMMPKMKIKKVL